MLPLCPGSSPASGAKSIPDSCNTSAVGGSVVWPDALGYGNLSCRKYRPRPCAWLRDEVVIGGRPEADASQRTKLTRAHQPHAAIAGRNG